MTLEKMYSISNKQIYNVVGQIYEAANDGTGDAWLNVYKNLSALISSGAGSLSLYSQSSKCFDFVATTLDRDLLEQYNDYYQFVSPFRKKIAALNAGETFSRSAAISDKEFLSTEIYQDYFKKQEVFHFEYQVLCKNEESSFGISFSRPETMKNFGKKEAWALGEILPHLQKAFQLYMNIAEVERDKRILLECLDRIPQSLIVLNSKGKIVFINESAGEVLARRDGLQLDKDGVLFADLAHETKKLKILLQSVFEPDINQAVSFGGNMKISRASGLRSLSILVSPFSAHTVAACGSEKFALVFIADPEQKEEMVESVLRELYALTDAESKIAVILAQGHSINEACEMLAIKPNTFRTHLKRIFSKTETGRQSELVKLILTSPASLKSRKI